MKTTHTPIELLAALLDGPDALPRAANLVAAVGGLHRLRLASPAALRRTGHLSHAEAERLRAAFLLAAEALAAGPPPSVATPAEVARLAAPLTLSPVEELWLFTTDATLRPLGRHLVARGGRSYCAIDTTDVLRHVVTDGGSGAFLVHNHPSGDPTPSELDRKLTRDVAERARLLGLTLHDHLVLAGNAWVSCLGARTGRIDR